MGYKFKEEDFTEDQLMLLKMGFKLLDTIVEEERCGNSDVYLRTELFYLKEKLGIDDIVD